MIIRILIGRWRVTFSMAPVTKLYGVHSLLKDGTHILMWDFDEHPLLDVMDALQYVQKLWNLPKITVFSTGKPNSYIAYCFKRHTFQQASAIIAMTPHIDWNFVKYGIYRNKFTLRVTPKNGRHIHHAVTMCSREPEDAGISDLVNWVKYETIDWDYKHLGQCKGCDSPLRHCINIGIKQEEHVP